jgi:hypothetical protein
VRRSCIELPVWLLPFADSYGRTFSFPVSAHACLIIYALRTRRSDERQARCEAGLRQPLKGGNNDDMKQSKRKKS